MRGCCIYKFRGQYFLSTKNIHPCLNQNFANATCERNPSFLLLALFVSLSHFPLPQNPVSLASSSLSLKIEHIGGNFRGIILAQQLVWVNHQMVKKFLIKWWWWHSDWTRNKSSSLPGFGGLWGFTGSSDILEKSREQKVCVCEFRVQRWMVGGG